MKLMKDKIKEMDNNKVKIDANNFQKKKDDDWTSQQKEHD